MSSRRFTHRTISGTGFLAILAVAIGSLLLLQVRDAGNRRMAARPIITEIEAANSTGLRDEDGQAVDWIEIWNPSRESLSLDRWALTDDFRDLRQWRFPSVSLAPGEFLVVFASGKNRTNLAAALHTNFRLDPEGEYLALVEARDGRVVQEFLPKYPKQLANTSFGLIPEAFPHAGQHARIEARDLGYLLQPTPAGTNADEMMGLVADTRFSRQRGVCSAPFALAISTRTTGAEIRYTLDGSVPSLTNGLRYAAPIEIDQTSVVRAAAFRPGYRPSNADTHTFVFPEQVPKQTGTGLPSTWGMRNGATVKADYEMDPEIINPPLGASGVRAGLASLPSVSLTLSPADLFDGMTGIYSHPLEHGGAWERMASFEWFQPDGTSDTHHECGVRIQGGWSRRPEESPKHSFRLRFAGEAGSAGFKHPLFESPGPTVHRELILRAGCNNSWLHWSGVERRRGELLRDQWMRDTLREMRQPAARGSFVHLYLNGLYWGIYNLVERPDADFFAGLFGGKAADYDARNGENVLSGDLAAWDQLFAVANAGVSSADAYAAISRLLDIPAFIDFMAVHLYGGSADMDRASNWYAARPRRAGGRYLFLMWDGERSLEEVSADALGLDDDQCPTRLFQRLRENEAFRAAFAQRIEQLTAPGGPLSPERCAQRYQRLAERLQPAVICESARWGDYRRDVHPYREGPFELYTVEQHWEPEVKRLLKEYFPQRTARFREQLRAVGLVRN